MSADAESNLIFHRQRTAPIGRAQITEPEGRGDRTIRASNHADPVVARVDRPDDRLRRTGRRRAFNLGRIAK